ncbi:MAG TPA: ABC transporter permease [Gemmatimonadaceae bacterium]|nr:ABC transporter permease [Gemmatimonadaceae bacterium]
MTVWRQVARGIRALTNRRAADQDVADEVQHYLEQATAAHRARGCSPDDALRAARLELGNVTGVRDRVRAYGWENAVDTALTDVRYAARRLRAAPSFTVITVLTLALGIGGTTAIFSAVRPILFEPLPYPHSDRIAAILEIGADGSRNAGTFGMYRGLLERNRSFEAMAVLKPWQPTMTGQHPPERLEGQRVSASYFRVLGVPPAVGRSLQPSDDRPGGPEVVILSDALWRRRFGGDRAIVGRQVTLDDRSALVIGIMPHDFENVLAPSAELWAPLQYDMAQGVAWGHHLRTVARLRPGVDVEQAAREVDVLGHAVLREQRPATYGGELRLTAVALHDDITGGVRGALLAFLGAVTVVLVIACVNVTNMLLARGVRRRGEFALRAALGAGRGRLVRQLLTESLLLAAMGGVVGMAVAVLGVRALVALSPPGLPRVGAIGVDGIMFAFGAGITTLIGVAFGLAPALKAARGDPHQALQQGSRRAAGGHRRARGALVVAEVALALVLLVSAGLLLRSLERLFAVPVGFDASRLLTMQVHTVGLELREPGATNRFFGQVLEAVGGVPGATAVALTSQLPLSGDVDEYGAHFEATPSAPARSYSVFRYAVSAGYIEAMRIPLRRGRMLDERDRADAPRVALISESLARRSFPGADPIGQRLRLGPQDGPPHTIVGVVGDVRQMSLGLSESSAVYIPGAQSWFADGTMSLVVRTRGDAAALSPAVRTAVWSVDDDQPVVRVATMDALLAASAAERRFVLILFGAFALAALVLAVAGIYGVLAGSVAERTREFGVRSALGASRGRIVVGVLRQGMTLTGLGVAIGLAGAAAASQSIAALLFGVSRLDPVTYLGVVTLLGLVSLIACWVPAWRAARVDPAIALRTE